MHSPCIRHRWRIQRELARIVAMATITVHGRSRRRTKLEGICPAVDCLSRRGTSGRGGVYAPGCSNQVKLVDLRERSVAEGAAKPGINAI